MQLLSTPFQPSGKQHVEPSSRRESYIELVEQAIVDYTQAVKSSQFTVRESFLVSLQLARELLDALHFAEEISAERQSHRKSNKWRSLDVVQRAELNQSMFSKRLLNAEKIRDLRKSLLAEQDKRSVMRKETKH